MARENWLDDKTAHPLIEERLKNLESFTEALSDGVITKQELSGQERRLAAAMQSVESELSDALHAKVTTVLVELTAYNAMRMLHELQAERARMAFER
jgi:hypothetical protein